MTVRLLELEVRVLVLKHGYKRVLGALSKSQGVTEEEIESALFELERLKGTKRKSRKIESITDIAARTTKKYPEKSKYILELARRFENKTYLPQMRDVRNFLVPFGLDRNSLKSRVNSAKIIIEKLCELSPSELAELVDFVPSGNSAFSELAGQIMGDRGTGKPPSN